MKRTRILLMAFVLLVSMSGVIIAQQHQYQWRTMAMNGGRIDQSSMPELKQYGLDNLSVDIPDGALKQQIRLQIRVPNTIPAEKAALKAAEFVVENNESGFTFEKQVTIAIPYPDSVKNEAGLTIMCWNETAQRWEQIDMPQTIVLDKTSKVVRAQVTHFSVYGVVQHQYQWRTMAMNGGRIDQSSMPELKQYGLDNLSVDIPDGALKQQIRLQIRVPNTIPAEKAALKAAEFVVENNESGFTFEKQVTIAIPYPDSVKNEAGLTIMCWNETAQRWEQIDMPQTIVLDKTSKVVRAQVTHFSVYGVVQELTPTTVNEHIPASFTLSQNVPNPFNPTTTIAFTLPMSRMAKLSVYNVLGQEVRSLLNGNMVAGNHSVVWNGIDDSGRAVTSGVYFYRLETGSMQVTKKLMLLR